GVVRRLEADLDLLRVVRASKRGDAAQRGDAQDEDLGPHGNALSSAKKPGAIMLAGRCAALRRCALRCKDWSNRRGVLAGSQRRRFCWGRRRWNCLAVLRKCRCTL